MKTVSAAFAAKMNDTFRTYVPRMTINGTAITGNVKDGLSIQLGSCGSENFTAGALFIPSFTASIVNCSTNLQDKEIYLEMGLKLDDGSIEYVPMGYFTVEKPTVDKYTTSFTAYGRLMAKMGGLFTDSDTYPQALNSVLQKISTASGVNVSLKGFAGNVPQISTSLNGYAYRDALAEIAGMLGGYVTEGADGNVYICKYSVSSVATIDTAFCYQYPQKQNEAYTVTGLQVTNGETVYASTGIANIQYENSLMNEAAFAYCESNLVGLSFMPATVNFLGDIRLEPFDAVTITDEGANGFVMPCMSILHTFDGGIVTVLQSVGTTTAENDAEFTGSLTQEVETMKVSKADITLANIDLANINRAKVQSLVAQNINVEQVAAGVVSSQTLQTNYAHITNGFIDNANVKNANIESINGSKIENGTVLAAALSNAAVQTLSGNKVYYQAEQPTGTFKDGDTWYKTVVPEGYAGKILFVYDSTNGWVGKDLDAKLLTAGSVSALEINTNSLATSSAFVSTLETNLERVGEMDGKHLEITDSAIYVYDGTTKLAEFGDSVCLYDAAGEAVVSLTTSANKIGGFEIVAAANGKDYLKSDYKLADYDTTYRTWIRSAQETNKGETWAFSTQRRRSEDDYRGLWYVKSNGEMFGSNHNHGIIHRQHTDYTDYTIYDDGFIEMNIFKEFTNVACTTSALGGYLCADQTFNYPNNFVFLTQPRVMCSMNGTSGSGYCMHMRTIGGLSSISTNFINTTKVTKPLVRATYHVSGFVDLPQWYIDKLADTVEASETSISTMSIEEEPMQQE